MSAAIENGCSQMPLAKMRFIHFQKFLFMAEVLFRNGHIRDILEALAL